MKVNELDLYRIIFKYPFNNIDWAHHPKAKVSSVLIDFYGIKSLNNKEYYVANVLNAFDRSSISKSELKETNILFGPVLCEQPLLRGKNKWLDLLRLEKQEEDCFPPKFYGATSKRNTNAQKKNDQYYYSLETGKYTESTYDIIGHLESPTVFNDFTIEVRIFIELLRINGIDNNIYFDVLKKALINSEVFEDSTSDEIDSWITSFINSSLLIPKSDLIPKEIRGKLNP